MDQITFVIVFTVVGVYIFYAWLTWYGKKIKRDAEKRRSGEDKKKSDLVNNNEKTEHSNDQK